MNRVFVDRIVEREEGEPLAVLIIQLAEGQFSEWVIPIRWLPEGTREGDTLIVRFEQDLQARQQLRQQITELLQELQQEE